MTAEELRQKVLAEAKSWIGTPFHHAARVKGAGVDCGQFLLEVYERAGLMEHLEVKGYAPDFHIHRDEEKYIAWLSPYCVEVDPPPLPADIILYKVGRVFSHGAIVVEWPQIIHSYSGHGVKYDWGHQGRHASGKGGPHETKFFRPRQLVTA